MTYNRRAPRPLQIIQDVDGPSDKAIFVCPVYEDEYLVVKPYLGVGTTYDIGWELPRKTMFAEPNPNAKIQRWEMHLVVSHGVAKIAVAADDCWKFWYGSGMDFGYGLTGETAPYDEHTQIVCACNPKGTFKNYGRGPNWDDVIIRTVG